jgi:hypothetical protein
MTMNAEDKTITMTPREALMTVSVVVSLVIAISGWLVLPHRVDALATMSLDHEQRLRKLEDIRISQAEMQSDIREIKAQMEKIRK